jgi:hypothetical protein
MFGPKCPVCRHRVIMEIVWTTRKSNFAMEPLELRFSVCGSSHQADGQKRLADINAGLPFLRRLYKTLHWLHKCIHTLNQPTRPESQDASTFLGPNPRQPIVHLSKSAIWALSGHVDACWCARIRELTPCTLFLRKPRYSEVPVGSCRL